MRRTTTYGLLLAALITSACGGQGATTAPHPADPVAWGGDLYSHKCAKCHGDKGEGGGKAPAVVGATALPLDPPPSRAGGVKFATANDVFDFVKKNMPPDHGGSLTDDEYWAILAFDLNANGVTPPAKLDATSAAQIKLH